MEAYSADERSGVQAEIARQRSGWKPWKKEKERTRALQQHERKYESAGFVCGIDEVGRGPLAGPVVAGAVILPRDCGILYLNDSKQLEC